MIKLRVDWQQTCKACGTELVIEFSDNPPAQCSCPWCGREAIVIVPNGANDARERLLAAVRDLETQINAELSS